MIWSNYVYFRKVTFVLPILAFFGIFFVKLANFSKTFKKFMRFPCVILLAHCESGGSSLVPAQQRTQVWERNPQVCHPSLCFLGQYSSYTTLHMIVIFHVQFTGQATSDHFSNFHQFIGHFQPIIFLDCHAS